MRVEIVLPDQHFIDSSPQEVMSEMKLHHALFLFQQGKISIGAACELADINIYDFMTVCYKYQIPIMSYAGNELEEEIQNALKIGEYAHHCG
ncbi:MAG: UPF0175 family protein [SAR324 cluster bacterium]|nr:UPF0175 family protein [SAR324 cluster bacterium]